MITKEYKIGGMTCTSCAAKIKSALHSIPSVVSAEVDKPSDTAILEMSDPVSLSSIEKVITAVDAKYSIADLSLKEVGEQTEPTKSWFTSYRPILLIFLYILTATLIIQFLNGGFDIRVWMRHFMAGFFLVFSFFKFLDLSGFADSYMTYDIIANKWRGWAYVYAFIELGLGLAYLSNCCPLATNLIAFLVMSVSIIGVLRSVLNKQKIQCACLGAVFDLPMSTVTIIEDALMILMSGYMITEFL